MSTEYILRKKPDGSLMAMAIPTDAIEIPVALLNQQIRLGANVFQHNDRQVTYARYVETDIVSMVINIPLLKWPTSLKNVGTNKWRITESQKKRPVHLKDVVLVTHQEAGKVREVYIVGKNGLIPRLTNIYEDGRICTGGIDHPDPQMMSPQDLIMQLENSDGNSDLCPNHDCTLALDGNHVVINPVQEDSSLNKFLKDRWEWK